jgi:hypothetical protein
MLGYEKVEHRHHRYDDYDEAGDGLTSVTAYMLVSTTWATMTFHQPYMTSLAFDDEASAKLWHEGLRKHLNDGISRTTDAVHCERVEASIIVSSRVVGRDHDRVMHFVRRELGFDQHERPPDLETIVVDEVSLRCRCAQGIMQLKHIIPNLPASQAQPLHLACAPYGNVVLQVNGENGISTTLTNSKQDLNRFTLVTPAVRWDALDPVLQTCHQRPAIVSSNRTRPEGMR